jgi:outer membrane protein
MNLSKIALTIAGSMLLSAGAAHAQLKVGTVDMTKIFASYYKTKDAEQRIGEAQATAKKEFEERMGSQKKVIEEINKLQDEARNPALSADAKGQKERARDEKINEARNLEREIQEFRVTRERQLNEQAVRMRAGIVEEIRKIIDEIVKSKGYDLVIDVSGKSLNGVPSVLFSKPDYDFSQSVIEQLNKTKPADAK